MNDCPCKECQRLRDAIIENWIARHHGNLLKLYREEREHKEVCVVINGSWYKGLWENATVGIDVVIA
jgi:hypothetical protein